MYMNVRNLSVVETAVKAVFVAFAWSILALTFACGSDPAAEEITPTYSIGGTVTKSDGGAASGASIQLQNAADGSNLGQTTTDVSGAYAFSGLPAGAYKIVVTFNGYETATIGGIDLRSDASGKDAVLQKMVVPTYTISGVATLSDGGVAAGASVQLQTAADNTLVGQAVKTDANGAYTLTGVPAGAYKIIITLDGYEAVTITGVEINSNVSGKDIVLKKAELNPDAVTIHFNGSVATIGNPYSASGVTVSVEQADVSVVSEKQDVEYIVSGTTSNGSLTIQSAKNLKLTMESARITATTLPAIQITGDVTTEIVLNGTSSLSDGANNTKNATLISKGGFVFGGYGTLQISGLAKHAISSSKDIRVESGNITIPAAASDGFHSEGFLMNSGSLNITATGDAIDAGDLTTVVNGGNINILSAAEDTKGIKGDAGVTVNGGTIAMKVSGARSKGVSSKKEVAITGGNITIETSGAVVMEESGSGYDPSYCTAIKADGTITVSSGTITINSLKASGGGKGLSADGDITITGGDVNVTTAGDGAVYTNEKGVKDSYSAACIKSDANISLLGGIITCNSSGTAGKGISADGTLTIGAAGANDNALVITASTTGQKFLVTGSTGSSPGRPGGGGMNNNADYANPKVIKSEGNMTVNSGTLRLNGTTDGGEGLESKATLTINGGNIEVRTVDDCINAATHIQINGGSLYCRATGNDAIDSNGTIEITGGTVIGHGSEEGLDCDNNPFIIKGGTVIGVGSQSMGGGPSSGSTQGYIKLTAGASTQLGVKNAAGEWILLYQVPVATSGGGMGGMGGNNSFIMLLSSPKFVKGNSYSFFSGGIITGGTTVNGYNIGGAYSGGTSKSFSVN
jgi:hypothetical protein